MKVERLWLALWELGEIVGALVIEETTKSYAKTITARNFIVRSRFDTSQNCLLNSNLSGVVFVWA